MALVDDVRIIIEAGNGGDGALIFLTTTTSTKKYADGGSGGRGGNIYFQASNNVSDLSEFRFKKKIKGEDGEKGQRKNLTGKGGQDITVLVPPGTTLTDENTQFAVEIIDTKKTVLIASGGRGGEGNHDYKSDVKHPKAMRLEGEKGQIKKLHLVLNLIADIGLIGLPNAGKSSLLAALTNATPKIGNYPFTTLEPNLGVSGRITLADIPGLIEGASTGRGLGTTFLKHIEKTKILLHCIDSSDDNPAKTYTTVREEFKEYNPNLLEKEEIILLTKTDLVDNPTLDAHIKQLSSFKKQILPVSLYDKKSIIELNEIIETYSKTLRTN